VPGLGLFSNFYEHSLPRTPEDTRDTSSAPASFYLGLKFVSLPKICCDQNVENVYNNESWYFDN